MTHHFSSDIPFLLTGASGVVGSELIRHLPAERLLLGRHRKKLDSEAVQVAIDICKPKLGKSESEYRELTNRISGIIHSAAITDMNGDAPGIHETNIDGVANIIALARAADVPLHYISTAYCSKTYGPNRSVESAYIESKRQAEVLVRESGLDWTIIRPSIVAGHSQTGAIASFQGFHLFITSILKGRLPFIPLDPISRCDFVPVDNIAKAIVRIVSQANYGETYWLTSGKHAVTIDDMLTYGRPFAKELGRDLTQLLMYDPSSSALVSQINDRLSDRVQGRLKVLVELSQLIATKQPFPSNIQTLLSEELVLNSDQLLAVLGNNLHYWGRANQHIFKTEVMSLMVE